MQKNTTYQNEAYDLIKDLIIKSKLEPGQKISKKELVTMLGIGDTPVREAIIRLTKEGLFRVVPQSGTYISKINLAEMENAVFMRENIESIIFSEAYDKITDAQVKELEKQVKIQEIFNASDDHETFFQLDEDFHKLFYIIAGKQFVWNWMRLVNISLNRYRHLRLELKQLSWDSIIEEHKSMVDCIKNNEKEKLLNIISSHLHMVDKDIKTVLEAFPDYFELKNEDEEISNSLF